ncbi:MAG: hypothetical protein P8171_04700 [Candidatus Thiodiazotropha sp.]
MNRFKILFLSLCLLGSAFVEAATSRYEVDLPNSSSHFQFPGLELSEVSKIKLTVSTSSTTPGYQLDRLELVFPQADNLIANNFKPDTYGSEFYAAVNNRWVFRRLNVEVRFPTSKPSAGGRIEISVYVATSDSFTSTPQPPQGELLVTAEGMLMDVTPNPAADTHWMKVDNEGLSMKLFQRAEINEFGANPGEGFKLALNWMGHGERTVYLPTPFDRRDYDRFKAVTLIVTPVSTPEGDEYQLEIAYEDETGYRQTYPVDALRLILDQAYQL